ncbi:Panacea domain-containing protein [Acinetobacter colistiniresistens]|uniref:Panacea domain-containing protein n=1 Tax=Acinetobacter colistiniresistens TaxID=280145 RepID=UPI000BDEBBC3|nr:type II toxin-antitoxin system antitoxin SocA domain-containing protein [Acinetobacter colistiniresistens]
MSIKALDVANYILWLENRFEGSEGITPLKLQKLVYYCQGFHLAMFGEELFPESIEAWLHGPVVPSVYHHFKAAGNDIVTPPKNFNIEILSEEQRELLDEVIESYGQFSAWRLRNMTHEEAPWKNAYEPGCNNEISIKDMKAYFETQLES